MFPAPLEVDRELYLYLNYLKQGCVSFQPLSRLIGNYTVINKYLQDNNRTFVFPALREVDRELYKLHL